MTRQISPFQYFQAWREQSLSHLQQWQPADGNKKTEATQNPLMGFAQKTWHFRKQPSQGLPVDQNQCLSDISYER